jgi:hypothetical protein
VEKKAAKPRKYRRRKKAKSATASTSRGGKWKQSPGVEKGRAATSASANEEPIFIDQEEEAEV